MENQFDVQNHLVEIQADDHDLLVNSDNENDDMLGYESEKYSDDADADGTNHAEDANGTNHSDMKLVKRGITRLYKFRRENGKHGEIQIKVDKESRDKLWDEITVHIDLAKGAGFLWGRVVGMMESGGVRARTWESVVAEMEGKSGDVNSGFKSWGEDRGGFLVFTQLAPMVSKE
nr:hypothetical protein [Tanacetum cinerariifolium]